MEFVLKLTLFGLLGLGMEVIFTSIGQARHPKKRNRQKLFGYSSLWYFPLYCTVIPAMLYLLQTPLEGHHWLVRGAVYALVIQVSEFMTMWTLRVINGESPSESEYRASGRSLYGLVRPDFFPGFILVGLIFEYFYGLIF
jgi:hypothetical protein